MVGISLLTFVPGVVGGSETYVRELLRALGRAGELEYRVLTSAGLELGDLADANGRVEVTEVAAYPFSASTRARSIAMARAAFYPGPIRRDMRLGELDAIHFPLSVMLPRVEQPAAAATIHDLQHEFFPAFFSRAELAYRRRAYAWTARRSRLVIGPSAFVARTLVERLEVDEEEVRVIHHGIDHERFSPAPGERQPFLLYPANRWPHKNHGRLFEAFALLRRSRPDLRLVLTGSGHPKTVLPAGVEAVGRVADDELVDLYRSASALVFPSLYEGFGAPPLEAMACGCPVACSTAGALPEIVGDAAALFDPRSAEAIADGIERALADETLPQRGIERAAGFTWEASARAHERVYRELA
jgi:glycosyltransferase involved in cell wall biosynthesis